MAGADADADAQIKGRSVKELRQLIEAAGLRHDDCLEKAELQSRAKEAVKRAGRSAASGKPASAGAAGGPALHRQFRVAWREMMVHMAPRQDSDGLAILRPGGLVMSTGRSKGKWIEVRFPVGRKGWLLPESPSGSALLLAVEERGRHGDGLEAAGGPGLLWRMHEHSLLRIGRLPSRQELNARWVDAAKTEELQQFVEDAGDFSGELYEEGRYSLRRRALEALDRMPLPEPGHVQIQRDGQMAHLLTPEALVPGRPLPLLLALHGAGKTEQVVSGMAHGLKQVARRAEILVLVPAARSHTWDFIFNGQREDVDFIDFALGEVRRQYCVDDEKIAVVGYSDGASMGLTLALVNPDIFSAAMVWAAGFFRAEPSLLPPGSQQPRLFVEYGTHDQLFPFEQVAVRNRNMLQKLGYKFQFSVDHGGIHQPRPTFDKDAIKFWLGRQINHQSPQTHFMQPHYAKGRELQFEFEGRWQELYGEALPAGAASELKWLLWNEAWLAANSAYAAEVGGEKRGEKLHKAEEDRARVQQHLGIARALSGLPEAALQRFRAQAAHAGLAAAASALKGRPLAEEAVKALEPPEGLAGHLPAWPSAVAVLRLAAAAVTEMLLDDYTGPPLGRGRFHRSEELRAEFEHTWQQHCGELLPLGLQGQGEDAAAEGPKTEDLQWLVWHEVQHAANAGYAAPGQGELEGKWLQRAAEHGQQAGSRRMALRAWRPPGEALECLTSQAELAGKLAAACATGGWPLSEEYVPCVAPEGVDEELWGHCLRAIHIAAGAALELLLDEPSSGPADGGEQAGQEAEGPAGAEQGPAGPLDLALGCPAAASSSKSEERSPAHAVDGSPDTRWTSLYEDGQWLSVDLGATLALSRVEIRWEKAHAKNYTIQGSNDGSTWETLAWETGREGLVSTGLPEGVQARWVRMFGQDRATEYGFSIWELRVYGAGAAGAE